MRIFKSLLVLLIGLTALMYALQNLSNIGEMRGQMEVLKPALGSPALAWTGFALVILCQLSITAAAGKGAWQLFAARKGSPEEFKQAKTPAVWAGALALLLWFAMSLFVGAGLFQWGTDSGAIALTKAFSFATTSALTILFVWGTTD